MTYTEAKKIFEFGDKYTSEELKHKYRNLMKKWHPDVNREESAIIMAQKIIEAEKILRESLEKRKSCTSHKTTSRSENFQRDYLDIVREECANYLRGKYLDNDYTFDKYNEIVALIITFREEVNHLTKYEDIWSLCHRYEEQIQSILILYVHNYCVLNDLYFYNDNEGDIYVNGHYINIKTNPKFIHKQLQKIELKEKDYLNILAVGVCDGVEKVKQGFQKIYQKGVEKFRNI